MTDDVRGVFVSSRDGDVMAFPTLEDAAASMEAIDVDAGEFPALYTVDGRVVQAAVVSGTVTLTATSRLDPLDLRDLLSRHCDLVDHAASPDDPVALANEMMRWEWEHRWPKRPSWLSRRLHGAAPPSI